MLLILALGALRHLVERQSSDFFSGQLLNDAKTLLLLMKEIGATNVYNFYFMLAFAGWQLTKLAIDRADD